MAPAAGEGGVKTDRPPLQRPPALNPSSQRIDLQLGADHHRQRLKHKPLPIKQRFGRLLWPWGSSPLRLASSNSLRSQLPNARRSVQNWQLWAVAAALSAAVTALLIKVGVQGVDAGMATLFRTLAVAIVLALVLLVSGRLDWQELRHLPALSLGALAVSGLTTGVSWFCYSRALQLGPVAGVAALDKLSVVLIALLALLLLGEQLDLKAWLGVVLMAIGAALVAWV